MNSVFVDTAALIALSNSRDNLHHASLEVRRALIQNDYRFVTTSLVLVELCNAFSHPQLRGTAVSLVEGIYRSSRWHVVEVDSELLQESFGLYRKMSDKSWGLVDCAGMIVARRLAISKIFTADHHFRQAGFEILLSASAYE